MTTIGELTEDIRRSERVLAPGSETTLWSDYCNDIERITGHLPYDAGDAEDVVLPDDVAEYWRSEYAALEAKGA